MSNRLSAAASAVIVSLALAACTSSADLLDDVATSSIKPVRAAATERDCLARAMFFESHRSSREGLIAVGSVVMNRVASNAYPDTICGVVGQKNQFAPDVLTRKMESGALPDVMAAADAVLDGERHPAINRAKFFHQAGLSFPYPNMHYVLQAGGNSFYEKRSRDERRASPARRQAQLAAAGRVEGMQTKMAPASSEPPVAALAFDIEPAKADAIGALIASSRNRAADQ